ncbi:MAG: type pantothenate kinase [Caulobacter sp.]|nr:type pantothenate kinase [Caulobacter sp.]
MAAEPIDIPGLAQRLTALRTPGQTLVVGITGAVAAGKSTLAEGLRDALVQAGLKAELVCTDGFLFPNAVLEAKGLTLRKGFPESYDTDAMMAAIWTARSGEAVFPGYSHTTYDIDPALTRTIAHPDILIVEGLGFPPGQAMADTLIYLDAEEADLEAWFVARFMRLWREAEFDPASFYFRFRVMDAAQAQAFGHQVWQRINLPNLRDHIVHHRPGADLVLRKAADHTLSLVRAPQ